MASISDPPVAAQAKATGRRKKKHRRTELPDLRRPEGVVIITPDRGPRLPELPTHEQLQRLAGQHGLPAEINAVVELENIWIWWCGRIQRPSAPLGEERRALMTAMAQRAEDLREVIEKANEQDLELISGMFQNRNVDFGRLLRDLMILQFNASRASERVPPSKRGRLGDPAIIELLTRLHRVYRYVFGANAPRLSRAASYGGAFFDFANDLLRLFGVRKTNAALGKAIEKALRAVDRQDAEAKVSPN